MAEEDRKDFFISYTKGDLFWAKWIAELLENQDYRTIYQHRDFPESLTAPQRDTNFIAKMHQALGNSRCTLALLSPGYLASRFCQDEWTAAFHMQTLQPIRVQECNISGLIGPLAYIDLVGLNEDEAREALLSRLRQSPEPAASTPFPGGRAAPAAFRFPGYPPPIWNVPHLRNPNFTGREQLLEDLRASLTAGHGAALTQTFAGLGGVGKTQMAAEYAYRFAPEYDLVWWLRSENATSLTADYAKLAIDLNLPEKDAPQQEVAVAAVRQKLRQLSKWLLIFDNANDSKDIKDFLPQGGGGHVIITSRNRAWGGLGKVVPVPVWERDESVTFLLKRSYSEKEPSEQEKIAAGQLADELGDLPLALEQAGAYIEACGCSIVQYLELFRSRHEEMLRRGKSSQEYPDTVATTWELSFQKVKEGSPAAADLLNLCAFLAPDDIPKELLVEGAKHVPQSLAAAVQDPVACNDTLAVLRRYSLMEVADDALAVHRLVQAVVRDRLDKNGKEQWAGAAVKIVNDAFPGEVQSAVENWPWCGRLLPHALTATGHAQVIGLTSDPGGRLLNQAGLYLRIRAEFSEALKAHERALAIGEGIFGPNHPKVATAVNNLGDVLQDLGDLKGAKAHYERALAIDEAAYGPDHPEVATDVNNLGLVLQDLGDLAGAKAHYERALAIDEAAFGPNHPKVAIRMNNLGGVLWAQGDLAGARAHLERALSIDEADYGRDHPKVAIRVNNLGAVLRTQGDLAGARGHYERARDILEKVHGPSHPHVATAVNNLGYVLQDLGDLAGARACAERALAICRQFLGEDHPKTKLVKRNLTLLG
jgi:tetratricopeptide (TPR) repeat protein